MKIGDRVRPIELEEDNEHLDHGTVTRDWSGKPNELIRIEHDSGRIVWHTADQLVKLN